MNTLSRDYIKYPLQKIKINTPTGYTYEKPCKEDIEYLYLSCNYTEKQMEGYFKITRRILQGWLKSYGIKKDKKHIKENIHKACLNKTDEEYSNISKKVKKTKLERYGNQNYNNRIKALDTCNEKYGVDNPNQIHISPEILKILNDKELLEKYIKDNNILNATELGNKLGVSEAKAARCIVKYGLKKLCNYTKSSIEKEIKEYITKYYDIENNVKIPNTNLEIDIFISKLNIGIEINGNYWHGELNRDRKYHINKSSIAEENGIFIYHIFEYEWNTKKEKILNQLNNLLGINQEKIYARKCIIKEVDNESKKDFLDKNHLQGNDNSSIKLGLYYNNELVSLMSFVKPRFNKKYEWELSRFCSKSGSNVIGGASKLFKYFIQKYNPKTIISYSNISHTKGNLYEMLDFKLNNISNPNYVWIKSGKVMNRYECQKHKLLKMGYNGDTEVEIMHNLGYYRIYDCGNKVWIWNKS